MSKPESFPAPAKAHLALVAVWAAVIAAARLIPTIPMMGTGSTFTFVSVLIPLAGIFFGPIAGALSAAAGGFVGGLLAPHTAWLGPWTFIIGTTTAFTTGCIAWGGWPPVRISRKGSFIVNGGIIVYLLGTVLWFTHEIGRSAPLFPVVVYGLGFAALIAGSMFAGKALAGGRAALKYPAIMICAFGGMIGGASIANFFTLALRPLPREVWMALVVVTPLERVAFSLGTAVIGASLLASLPKIGIFLGPQREDPSDGDGPEGEGRGGPPEPSP